MSERVILTGLGIASMFSLILFAGGALLWMAIISGPQPTPAQETVIQLADWTIKGSVGAMLGFAGGVGLAGRREASA